MNDGKTTSSNPKRSASLAGRVTRAQPPPSTGKSSVGAAQAAATTATTTTQRRLELMRNPTGCSVFGVGVSIRFNPRDVLLHDRDPLLSEAMSDVDHLEERVNCKCNGGEGFCLCVGAPGYCSCTNSKTHCKCCSEPGVTMLDQFKRANAQ